MLMATTTARPTPPPTPIDLEFSVGQMREMADQVVARVQLEANALDWLREWMDFPPEARGLFTTGGSMAIFNAIVCARERHLGADIRAGVLYTSDQAHHSVLKSAKLAGIMPDRVRPIESDDRFRLRMDRLQEAIAADRRASLAPFAVVSSAGTTNTGAVDPLDAIADLCAREGLWHHVDGAYGAFFYLCAELRTALRGLERADSLTLDPHKGLFLPYGTGALLVRDGAALRAAHEATAAYLPAAPHPEDFYDPSQHSPELSRGFPGLRVWLAVKLYGSAAFREAIAEKRAPAVSTPTFRRPRSPKWPPSAERRSRPDAPRATFADARGARSTTTSRATSISCRSPSRRRTTT